jgi:hypothetical protein
MHSRGILIIALIALSTGCYRATINTGRAPSGEAIQQDWAHSFIGGLVPPATVEAASRCPNGVASVVTQHSFLNMVAHAVTFGIYSPMTITVQCAAAGGNDEAATAMAVPEGAALTDAMRVFNDAADRARDNGTPVLVRFE